jgi:hypothetical protein
MEKWLFANPLFINGYCIFAYLTAVAQQRVYMLQYACMCEYAPL